MSDYRFSTCEHNNIPCLHVLIDGDDGETHIPIDDIQAHFREQGFKDRETIDLASSVMQRAQTAIAAIETATESNHAALLAHGLEDIIALCQAQFPQVKEEPILTISYTVDSMAFNCIKCGSPLTLKKRSLHCAASGIVCNCGESYYTSWDGTLNRGGIS